MKSTKDKKSIFNRFKDFFVLSYYETKVSLKSEGRKRAFINFAWMLIGTTILAFGTAFFIIPNDLVTGGVSGIAIIVKFLFEEIGKTTVDVGLIITILTWCLFVIGLFLLGIRFTFKTLIATIAYPPLIFLFQFMINNIGWLQIDSSPVSLLLGGLFGGVFVGVGCGCTFIGGGSTGGVDCLSLAANKYLHVKTAIASFLIDGAIILAGFIINKGLERTLIGIVSAIMAAIMIDRVFLGQSTSFIAWIVTPKFDELSERIQDEIERGTTLFIAEGGYTNAPYKVVEVVFDRKEYHDIQRIISEVDPASFVTTMRAHEVRGDGFKKMVRNKKLTIEELKARDKKLKEKKTSSSEEK